MKIFYQRLLLAAVFSFINIMAFAQPGVLDQTFGVGGKIQINIAPYAVIPIDIKIQTDKKILVLSMLDTSSYFGYDNGLNYVISRFLPNGLPDSTFASNGSTPVIKNHRPSSMEILSNGQIFVSSAYYTPSIQTADYDFCLTKYNSNGSIDNIFGNNGSVITDVGFHNQSPFVNYWDMPVSIFILANGKIIQGGYSQTYISSGRTTYHSVVRINANGILDTTYGNKGKLSVKRSINSQIDIYLWRLNYSMAIFSTEKIIATSLEGFTRFTANGVVDSTFGLNGLVSSMNKIDRSNISPGLVQPNDKMVFVARDSLFPFGLKVVRYNTDGSPDASFQPRPLENAYNQTEPDYGQIGKLMLEPNGQFNLAAYSEITNNSFLTKINNDGTVDSSYGRQGAINHLPFEIWGRAAETQTDGKIVVGGRNKQYIYTYPSYGIIARYEKNALVRYNTIIGNIFNDKNSNGIKDSNEGPINSYPAVSVIKSGVDTFRHWSSGGRFMLDVDTGTYQTKINVMSPYFTLVPASKTTAHATYWNTDTLLFGLQKMSGKRDLSISISTLTGVRPGFHSFYRMKVSNAGTDTATNVVIKLIKSNRLTFNSASLVPNMFVYDTLTWTFASFQPQTDSLIWINFTVNATPSVNIGDTLHLVANISSDKPDLTPADNSFSLTQIAVGAYDPNGKTEAHGGKIPLSKAVAGEYLTYNIRFQNTGNDTAFNVYIRDTMDSKLDWSSLQIVTASHNYNMAMNDGKCLFTFPMIKLVDSFKNQSLSHGYIVYKIKIKPNVQVGDVIKNTAAIYFDYNLPVITNTETTTLVADAQPLKLLSFTAKKEGTTNLLNWISANEVNVDRFEIERSLNGRDFGMIGKIKAGMSNYSFTDNNPLKATNYYRLKMVDKDAQFTYSTVRMLNNSGSFYVSIYPNPAKDNLQVQIDSDKKTALQIQVLSADGKVLMSSQTNASEGSILRSINISALPKGSYFLKLTIAERDEQMVRFEKL